MARIKFADCLAVADRIAEQVQPTKQLFDNWPEDNYPMPIRGFDWFGVDMTQAYVPQADGGKWKPAMARVSGQKTSDRELWKLEETSDDKIAKILESDRLERVAALEISYNVKAEELPESGFEFDVPDYITFATRLAEACHRLTDSPPMFLIAADGEADIY